MSFALIALPLSAKALLIDDSHAEVPGYGVEFMQPPLETTQGGMTLSEAIAAVKRDPNVKQIISAETRGGTHHIKVLYKDGKVRTHRFPAK